MAAEDPSELAAGVLERASTDAVTIGRNATTRTALRTMLEEHVEHLPVVEGERLVGICTRTDVLSARRTQIEHERRQRGWSQVVLPRMFACWSPADTE